MSFNFHPARGRAIAAARAGCLAAALVALAPAARAQALFDFTDVPPGRIARGLESSGYDLRGPLMRRGDVYVADVAGQGVRYRLVLDARTGQLLERYPMRDLLDERPRWRERNLAEEFDGPPRAGLDSDDDADSAPPRRRAPPGQVARGDLAPPPPVLDGDDAKAGGADTLEHAKPKPRVVKHKPAPVASTSPKASEPTAPGETPQGDAAPAAASAQPAPRPAATPEPAKTVVASPPADTPKPVAPAPPPEPPRTEATKPIAQADPAPAPTPKPSPKAKAINDLPVNTLD
jgi:hypothetical protein